MKSILFYDTKEYEKPWLEAYNGGKYIFDYTESKLSLRTAALAKGYDGVCIFVNDDASGKVVSALKRAGVGVIALRCSGFNQVDRAQAEREGIAVVRVATYSPYSVAEHAIAMLQTLNRKIHKAYIRTRDFNFSLSGLLGFDLHGKTAGVIGTGRIGRCFADICKGFGMKVLCYDLYPDESSGLTFVGLDDLLKKSDVISLHCPLTEETQHIIDGNALKKMKKTAILVNTSRGALVDSEALLSALVEGRLRGACLDVYEEEADLFYEDNSGKGISDGTLSMLLSRPNVIITSHQAYFTEEALSDIARTTVENLDGYFQGRENEKKL